MTDRNLCDKEFRLLVDSLVSQFLREKLSQYASRAVFSRQLIDSFKCVLAMI